VPDRSIFLGGSKCFPLVNRLYMHPSSFSKPRPRSSPAESTGIDPPRPTTIGAARALPLHVDPLLLSLFLAPDPKNRLPGEPSTFPALFPLRLLAGALPLAAPAPRSGSSGLGPDHPAPSKGKTYCWAESSGLWADHPTLGTFQQSEAKTFC